jgi:hypothetical protein
VVTTALYVITIVCIAGVVSAGTALFVVPSLQHRGPGDIVVTRGTTVLLACFAIGSLTSLTSALV